MENDMHEAPGHGFDRSTGLIAAVAQLLEIATENAGSKIADKLDDTTLLSIANTLYKEALVAESMYIQLQDIHHQAITESVAIYNCLPQLRIPLNRLSIQQLEDARMEASMRVETLNAYSDDGVAPDASETEISGLLAAISDIDEEIARR